MIELRCPNGIKFAELRDGLIEVKCRSRMCGHWVGAVVIHIFNAKTGELVDTKQYRQPVRQEGVAR